MKRTSKTAVEGKEKREGGEKMNTKK